MALWFWNSATIFQHQWKCTCLSDRKTQWSLIIFPLSLSYGLETMSVIYRIDFVFYLSHVESSAHVWVILAMSWFDHVVQASETKYPLGYMKLCLSYSLRKAKIKIVLPVNTLPVRSFRNSMHFLLINLKWRPETGVRRRGEQGLRQYDEFPHTQPINNETRLQNSENGSEALSLKETGLSFQYSFLLKRIHWKFQANIYYFQFA